MPDDKSTSQPVEIPAGMMRVWDPEQKKVIFVQAPPPGPDRLRLTIRLHDPKEKVNAKLAASWVTVEVEREDLRLPPEEFAAKYVTQKIADLEHFKPKT